MSPNEHIIKLSEPYQKRMTPDDTWHKKKDHCLNFVDTHFTSTNGDWAFLHLVLTCFSGDLMCLYFASQTHHSCLNLVVAYMWRLLEGQTAPLSVIASFREAPDLFLVQVKELRATVSRANLRWIRIIWDTFWVDITKDSTCASISA